MTISSTIPTRFPYKFKGWSTSSSASSASYVGGNSYYDSANSSTSMYAVWESANNLNLTNNSTGSTYINPQGVTGYWKFTAPETATYAFESTGSSDTYGYLYNSSGTQLSSNDDGGDNNNFKITYPLTAGTTYYLGAKYHSSSTTGTINVKARRQYDVKYNANGGSGAPSAQTKLYGDSVALSSTEPTNGDFKFLGWSTSADSDTVEYNAGDTYSADADATLYAVYEPISGQCGDNLTWTLTSDGTLTISGTGDMWNFEISSNKSPWYQYRGIIKNVIINSGVTSIGDEAFRGSGLTSVAIPDSVTNIGNYSFSSCSGLTNYMLKDCKCFTSHIDLCETDSMYEVRFRLNSRLVDIPTFILAEYTDGAVNQVITDFIEQDNNIFIIRGEKIDKRNGEFNFFVWNSLTGMMPF